MTEPASLFTESGIDTDTRFMDHALALAARGLGLASPNPMVGAVLVKSGKIVGEGYHTYVGVRHAESIALDAAGEPPVEEIKGHSENPECHAQIVEGQPTMIEGLVGRTLRHDINAAIPPGLLTPEGARGATLYINLEPCSHTGRTAPCTQALVTAGVARVVAAMEDPNPLVAGRGFRQLRSAGIKVDVGLREAEARRLNETFARWIVTKRPLVTLKSALTLDGQLVLPRAKGRSRPLRQHRWISSTESRKEVQRMRHASDALVTGIGTILDDDPLLTDRTGLPRRRNLLRVVMDSRLRLPLRSKLVRSACGDVVVFTRAPDDSPKARALRSAGIEVVRLPGSSPKPDLRAAIGELGRREILSVLLEAGAKLNSAALSAGIVDKMRVFFAPKVAGFAGEPGKMRASNGFHRAQQLQDVTMAQFGVDFAVEGYLRNVYRTR